MNGLEYRLVLQDFDAHDNYLNSKSGTLWHPTKIRFVHSISDVLRPLVPMLSDEMSTRLGWK